jgi:hypothetical protein
MYPVWAVAVAGAFLIWLSVLTFLILKQRNFFKDLFPKDNSRDIRNKFKEVLEAISGFEKNNQILENRLRGFKKDSLDNFSKWAVLKYNPYNDTGGDQSFSLAILNGKMDGMVMTSLHSRATTRIYLKDIKSGKSELELSKEEAKVLKDALDS